MALLFCHGTPQLNNCSAGKTSIWCRAGTYQSECAQQTLTEASCHKDLFSGWREAHPHHQKVLVCAMGFMSSRLASTKSEGSLSSVPGWMTVCR